jgi:methylenetetrahydrofolate reductase (NADPH)
VPQGETVTGDFSYAHELVDYIRKTTGDHFRLTVAAYPEYHPEAASPQKDIDNLKRKMDAGANDIITQYFFNPDSYFYFRDQCVLAGIQSDITVGVMPITNLDRLARFSEMCGAEIPLWIRKHLTACGADKNALIEFGKNVLIPFCNTLKKGGAPGFHFYTLNQAQPTFDICEELIKL